MSRNDTPEWRNQLNVARAQALQQWQAMGERERLGLQIAAAVLVALLFWSIALAPALRTLKAAPAQIEAVELQLQKMQAQAAEAKTLRGSPTVSTAQAQAALTSASERLGSAARLAITGDRAVLTLNGVGSEPLQAWLGEVRAAGRARPVEAQLTRGSQGFSGSVVLVLGGVGS
jgi:general secretion pathway protein M